MDGRRARIVLGVARDAGPDEIRRAFRARALVTHPDHGGDRNAFADLTDALVALDPLVAAMPARAPASVPVALPPSPPRFDAYDSPRRPAPRRAFADVLQIATARLG
jgi:DnaJ domain